MGGLLPSWSKSPETGKSKGQDPSGEGSSEKCHYCIYKDKLICDVMSTYQNLKCALYIQIWTHLRISAQKNKLNLCMSLNIWEQLKINSYSVCFYSLLSDSKIKKYSSIFFYRQYVKFLYYCVLLFTFLNNWCWSEYRLEETQTFILNNAALIDIYKW